MSECMTMQRYRCHKEVHAVQIAEVKMTDADSVGGGTWDIVSEGNSPIRVTHTWYCHHKPVAGGYYVLYEGGYASYSPMEAFENGYTLIT